MKLLKSRSCIVFFFKQKSKALVEGKVHFQARRWDRARDARPRRRRLTEISLTVTQNIYGKNLSAH